MPKPLTFALDYDGTFTEDHELWFMFIKLAINRGHTVLIVTMRHPTAEEALPVELTSVVNKVYYTGRRAKVPFMEDEGIKVSIWIDDSPHWLLLDSAPDLLSPSGVNPIIYSE